MTPVNSIHRLTKHLGTGWSATCLLIAALSSGYVSPVLGQGVAFSFRVDTLAVGISQPLDVIVEGAILRAQPVNAIQFRIDAPEYLRIDSMAVAGNLAGWSLAEHAGRVAAANLGASSLVLGGVILRVWITALREGDAGLSLQEILLNGGQPAPEKSQYRVDFVVVAPPKE